MKFSLPVINYTFKVKKKSDVIDHIFNNKQYKVINYM